MEDLLDIRRVFFFRGLFEIHLVDGFSLQGLDEDVRHNTLLIRSVIILIFFLLNRSKVLLEMEN